MALSAPVREMTKRRRGDGRRATAIPIGLLVAAATLGALAGPAQAPHQPELVSRCTYESGGMDFWAVSASDPAGLTEDGDVAIGGCAWTFPDADPGGADGPPLTDLTGTGLIVSGEYSEAQASLVDDVFGPEVGADLASDADHDGGFGDPEKGEFSATFCTQSPVFTSDIDHDGDGHPDLAFQIAVFLNGPYAQALNCDPVANPVGATTGGILDPAGGIFMTLSG